jgi:hypothetical protein
MSKVLINHFAPRLATVSKGKSPQSLVDRMPSPDLAAKVGPIPLPAPGGGISAMERRRQVVRRNARD